MNTAYDTSICSKCQTCLCKSGIYKCQSCDAKSDKCQPCRRWHAFIASNKRCTNAGRTWYKHIGSASNSVPATRCQQFSASKPQVPALRVPRRTHLTNNTLWTLKYWTSSLYQDCSLTSSINLLSVSRIWTDYKILPVFAVFKSTCVGSRFPQ